MLCMLCLPVVCHPATLCKMCCGLSCSLLKPALFPSDVIFAVCGDRDLTGLRIPINLSSIYCTCNLSLS